MIQYDVVCHFALIEFNFNFYFLFSVALLVQFHTTSFLCISMNFSISTKTTILIEFTSFPRHPPLLLLLLSSCSLLDARIKVSRSKTSCQNNKQSMSLLPLKNFQENEKPRLAFSCELNNIQSM
jgi:hypothetical protein